MAGFALISDLLLKSKRQNTNRITQNTQHQFPSGLRPEPSAIGNQATNTIIKFADDTTVVGLISGGDETAYRAEVENLFACCSQNNLSLNVCKTKELIIDFRKHGQDLAPLVVNGERVESIPISFLSTQISADILRKQYQDSSEASGCIFCRFPRKITWTRNCFRHASVESTLTCCLGVWYAGSTVEDRNSVQRVINTAQKNHWLSSALPGQHSRVKVITGDPAHHAHHLFDLLPSGRRFRSIKSHTTRLTNSFFLWAIRTANKQ